MHHRNRDILINKAGSDTLFNLLIRSGFKWDWRNGEDLSTLVVDFVLCKAKSILLIVVNDLVVNIVKSIILVEVVTIPFVVCLESDKTTG